MSDEYTIRKISAIVESLALRYESKYPKAKKQGSLDDLRKTILDTLKTLLGNHLSSRMTEKFYKHLSPVVFDRRAGAYNNNYREMHGARYVRGAVEGLWHMFFTETQFPFDESDDEL